jgi:hypothetical protein
MEKTAPHAAELPRLARLNYFFGQVLGPDDLRVEQAYFHEKLRLHNRCLHGFGVVCGLLVEPEPPPHGDADRCVPGEERPRVRLEPGFALDCDGNEIVVREPCAIDLWEALGPDGQRAVEAGHREVFVSICFKERFTHPARPALPDACGGSNDCQHARIEDAWELRVSTERHDDERCDTCCEPCRERCVLLARIVDVRKGHSVAEHDVHNGVRRMVSRYDYTTITGINWVHGATYRHRDVQQLLRHGLKVHFSRPVRRDTVQDGVADLWVIHDERLAEVTSLEGELETEPGEFTRWVAFRRALKERLQDGDRLLLMLRSAFLLDRCCRPVDGLHVGGRVPHVVGPGDHACEPYHRPHRETCAHPPTHPGPWRSGNGVGGGTFESWFWIKEDEAEEEHEEHREAQRRGEPMGGPR